MLLLSDLCIPAYYRISDLSCVDPRHKFLLSFVLCLLSALLHSLCSLLAVSGLNAASLLAFFSPVSLHSTYSKSHCQFPFQRPSLSLPPPHLCLSFIRLHSSLQLHLSHQRLESAAPTLIPMTAGMSFRCDGPSDSNHQIHELNSFPSNGLSFLN